MSTTNDGYPRSICAGEAIALMRTVVDECGRDHTYTNRSYIDDVGTEVACVLYVCQGEADCMFGRMLERFGVPCSRMSFICHLPIQWALARLAIICPPGLAHSLWVAQILHDIGTAWGTVLDYFEAAVQDASLRGVRI